MRLSFFNLTLCNYLNILLSSYGNFRITVCNTDRAHPGPHWRRDSILTVPLLVYLVKLSPVTSTAYSLFVVGSNSLAVAISHFRKKQLCYRAAIAFSVPSFVSVFLTRRFLVPLLPDTIVEYQVLY
jgi:hypothetical protein